MIWISPAPSPVDGPMIGNDRPILEGMLAHHRATLLNICAGLTAEQLATRPIASSNLSLLGLVRHLAVERVWFRKRVAGQDIEHLHNFEARDDTDFDVIDPADAPDAVEQLRDEWALADRAVAGIDFAHTIGGHDGEMSLRMIYVHMIQEYARHNGHADLLREAIDGATGR
jgi:uncharacterized damage-inducible protein DinB